MTSQYLVVRGAELGKQAVDLVTAKGRIKEVRPYDRNEPYGDAHIIEAAGLMLFPSLIDCHTHLREPGFEYKEDISSGLKAAAHGGFGQIMCMANTKPVNDSSATTFFMLEQAGSAWPDGPRLHPIGALTMGLEGKKLAPLAELVEAGCAAFSNDGMPVMDTQLFRHGIQSAHALGRLVIDHCEDYFLAKGGVMNESEFSDKLGLDGQPTVAESLHVARDILLAGYLDIPIHLAHISCRESVELIAWAKQRGIRVTAETCPHYLLFTEHEVERVETLAKVNPPLRTMDDVEAIRQALRQGVIDILATDHAPHAAHEKESSIDKAPPGISGFDTALSLTWGLAEDGVLDQDLLVRAWLSNPATTFSLPANHFIPGDPADFLLFDPSEAWELSPEAMHSKGKNTPCLGRTLKGRVTAHFIGGKPII